MITVIKPGRRRTAPISHKVLTESVVADHFGLPGKYYCFNLFSDFEGALALSTDFQRLDKEAQSKITNHFKYGEAVAPIVRVIALLEIEIEDAMTLHPSKTSERKAREVAARSKIMEFAALIDKDMDPLAPRAPVPTDSAETPLLRAVQFDGSQIIETKGYGTF